MKKEILYVEDDDCIRGSFKMFFDMFHNVHEAQDGKDGLSKFNKLDNLDLIITDISMPLMNGLDMVEEIRKINKEITVYVISAFDDERYTNKAEELNIARFISKPLNVKEILNYINSDLVKG